MVHRHLDVEDIDPDPIVQFGRWFADAQEAGQPEPESMALATSTPGGAPSVRFVLLKGVDQRGFVFYTNYRSRKGRELSCQPPRLAGVSMVDSRAPGASRRAGPRGGGGGV